MEPRPEPVIEHPRDAVLRVTRTAICGSDLHLYRGLVPDTRVGHVFGHEFTGIVEEVGAGVTGLRRGDRVVVPFNIACGECFWCRREQYSVCGNANPNSQILGGAFGYSHSTGGYDGGQAEYVPVPYADVGPMKIPDDMTDEQVLFLSDILPTGWQAAGRVVLIGVYGPPWNLLPVGTAMNKGVTIRTGQADVKRSLTRLLELVRDGSIDAAAMTSHRLPLEEAPAAYERFASKADGYRKVVLIPDGVAA